MKIKLVFSVVCAFLFYSVNCSIIEKEICEKLSTGLLELKEFIAESKAEYDKSTNNTGGVFQGIKRFRLKGKDGLVITDADTTSPETLFNITLYAVNNQNYEKEILVSDNEKRKVLHTGSVTRCISPALAYDSWSVKQSSFSSWHGDIERTEIENKTYSTSYSETDETLTEIFGHLIEAFKVNVSALSKVKVTNDFLSYGDISLYSVEAVLEIRSEDFETSVEQSDDAVKAAAFEFFDSEYWKNVNEENLKKWPLTIEVNFDNIILTGFPLVVKSTSFDLKRDIGKDEPLS